MSWLYALYVVILIATWITAGVFVTTANIQISNSKTFDTFLNRAYWMTFSAAFITWFLVSAVIVLIVLGVVGVVALFGSGVGEAGVAASAESGTAASYFSGDALGTDLSWITILLFIVMMVLVIVTGILAATAATNINQSNASETQELLSAYDNCVISAIIAIGVFILFVLGFVVYIIYDIRRKKQLEALQQQEIETRAKLEQDIRDATERKKLAIRQQEISSLSQLYRPDDRTQAPLYTQEQTIPTQRNQQPVPTQPMQRNQQPMPVQNQPTLRNQQPIPVRASGPQQPQPILVQKGPRKPFIPIPIPEQEDITVPPIQGRRGAPIPVTPLPSRLTDTPSVNQLYNVAQPSNLNFQIGSVNTQTNQGPVSILRKPINPLLPPKTTRRFPVTFADQPPHSPVLPQRRTLTRTQTSKPTLLKDASFNPNKALNLSAPPKGGSIYTNPVKSSSLYFKR